MLIAAKLERMALMKFWSDVSNWLSLRVERGRRVVGEASQSLPAPPPPRRRARPAAGRRTGGWSQLHMCLICSTSGEIFKSWKPKKEASTQNITNNSVWRLLQWLQIRWANVVQTVYNSYGF